MYESAEESAEKEILSNVDDEPLSDSALLLEMVLPLVIDTEEVDIEEKEISDLEKILIINVPDDQKGLVIGKHGKTLEILRSYMSIVSLRRKRKIIVKVKGYVEKPVGFRKPPGFRKHDNDDNYGNRPVNVGKRTRRPN